MINKSYSVTDRMHHIKSRWEGNIIVDLKDMMWEGEDWIHLARDSDYWTQ
jgi:hypothetical protein